jgi:hypothetical protein
MQFKKLTTQRQIKSLPFLGLAKNNIHTLLLLQLLQ